MCLPGVGILSAPLLAGLRALQSAGSEGAGLAGVYPVFLDPLQRQDLIANAVHAQISAFQRAVEKSNGRTIGKSSSESRKS